MLNALVGSAGLAPTLATLQSGKTLALANKESLVVGGELVTDLIKGEPERLLPVDSEHAALAMALRGERREDLKRVVLTGSGGPFRGWTRSELAKASVKEALAAPGVDDGPEDHDRLGHPHEQGPRGHRGALPLRSRVLLDPRADPPRGRSCTRWPSSATAACAPRWPARHAPADPARPGLARATAHGHRAGAAHRASAHVRARRPRGVPSGRPRLPRRRARVSPSRR